MIPKTGYLWHVHEFGTRELMLGFSVPASLPAAFFLISIRIKWTRQSATLPFRSTRQSSPMMDTASSTYREVSHDKVSAVEKKL